MGNPPKTGNLKKQETLKVGNQETLQQLPFLFLFQFYRGVEERKTLSQ